MAIDISDSHGTAPDHIRRALAKKNNKLTTLQADKLIMIERVDELIKTHGRNLVCIKAIEKEFGKSRMWARKMIDDTIQFFSYETNDEKKYHKRFHIDVITALIARNKDSDDPKVLKAMEGLLKEYRLATKFDVAEIELPDFSKIGQTNIIIASDPKEANLDEVKDANKFIKDFMSNIDAEDVEDVVDDE